MSEILTNRPNAVFTCFLYERLQNKSIDDAYKSVCRNLKIEEFDKEIDNLDSKELLNSIKSDENGIEYCTIYEFIQKKPLGEAYKSISTALGNDVIDFKELKIRFENFKNGKFGEELKERKPTNFFSKNLNQLMENLKTGSDEPALPCFPKEVTEMIVEKLELKERLILRKVSRKLRSIVDTQKFYCDKIEISFGDRSTVVRIGSLPKIEYDQTRGPNCVIKFDGKKKTVKGYHFFLMLTDLESFMKNPKFELGTLTTGFLLGVPFAYEGCFIPVMETSKIRFHVLKTFFETRIGHQLHVKSFDIQFEIHGDDDGVEPVMSILPYLKPGILEKIRIKFDFDWDEMMRKVVELEQWKQAKELDMRKAHFSLPLTHFVNFEKFVVFLPKPKEDEILKMKETLFKIPTFESCSIHCYEDDLDGDVIVDGLGEYIEDDYGYALFKSPDTNNVYNIQVNDELFRMTKHTDSLDSDAQDTDDNDDDDDDDYDDDDDDDDE